MNQIIREVYPLFKLYQSLRDQMLDLLNDADLGYRPDERNPTLGALCREIGEVEQAYIDSFKTFSQDFSYRHPEPLRVETSVSQLKTWYAALDAELRAAVEGLTDEDLETRLIDRDGNFRVSPRFQLEIYKEALLIFYGKSSVYLKSLGKELPEQWQEWIA